jgi:hypothetical protein
MDFHKIGPEFLGSQLSSLFEDEDGFVFRSISIDWVPDPGGWGGGLTSGSQGHGDGECGGDETGNGFGDGGGYGNRRGNGDGSG